MKKCFRIILLFIALTITTLACSTSPFATSTTAPIPPESTEQEPPFVGLWMRETETLVFTRTSLYRVTSNPELGQTNEQFAEIISFDLLNNHITLRTRLIKVNGKSVGFDAPTYTLTYLITGDTLQIGRGTETEFTTELDPQLLYQQK
ncbi:MAG: hypothetical protein JNM55_08975 [Anaerolineales bacterium]|nr:hypothetical protein [Anaerolineales bacterium]